MIKIILINEMIDRERKCYEKPIIDVTKLKDLMQSNIKEAEYIKEYIKNTDRNLFNTQDVIEWQDRLNKISVCDPNEP